MSLADQALRRDVAERGLGPRSFLVAISTGSALLLAFLAVGSQNALLRLERSRLMGDPADLVRIYLYFPMDGKDLATVNSLEEFRRRSHGLFEDAKAMLQPLAAKQLVSASYPDIVVQQTGTTQVRLLGPAGVEPIETQIRSAIVAPGYFELLKVAIVAGEGCPATLNPSAVEPPLSIRRCLDKSKCPSNPTAIGRFRTRRSNHGSDFGGLSGTQRLAQTRRHRRQCLFAIILTAGISISGQYRTTLPSLSKPPFLRCRNGGLRLNWQEWSSTGS